MLAFNTDVRTTPCRSCGAYRGSQCPSTCQPGRKYQLGRSRRAGRDRRTSAMVREYERIQESLIQGL
jgi:hypothetical protein